MEKMLSAAEIPGRLSKVEMIEDPNLIESRGKIEFGGMDNQNKIKSKSGAYNFPKLEFAATSKNQSGNHSSSIKQKDESSTI